MRCCTLIAAVAACLAGSASFAKAESSCGDCATCCTTTCVRKVCQLTVEEYDVKHPCYNMKCGDKCLKRLPRPCCDCGCDDGCNGGCCDSGCGDGGCGQECESCQSGGSLLSRLFCRDRVRTVRKLQKKECKEKRCRFKWVVKEIVEECPVCCKPSCNCCCEQGCDQGCGGGCGCGEADGGEVILSESTSGSEPTPAPEAAPATDAAPMPPAAPETKKPAADKEARARRVRGSRVSFRN